MPSTRRPLPRPLAAGLLPLALVVGSLPLLAPTCGDGTEGQVTFARGSLIIPMDRCYQFQTDTVTGTGQPAGCPQTADPGDVVKAYGLVYQLIRNDVAVHWVIRQDKTSLTDYDLQLEYGSGPPALLYDWASGGTAGAPTTQAMVRYMGGPFVVDGSDYEKASAVLQAYKTTFSGVNVHVANVAFRGYAKKTMAGGWSAGGATPPKLALLDIGSGNITSVSTGGTPTGMTNPRNAEPVIEGYLARAGIGSGTAAGTAAGPHGEIYDRLGIDDFQPAAGSTDWRTSRFAQNGYQILWVPHWVAPGSCSNFSSVSNCLATLFPEARIDQVLKTIGGFVASGNDLFAECAGLGSFEGAFRSGSNTQYTIDYEDGDPTTRFQTTTGVRYNEIPDVNGSVSGKQLPPPLFAVDGPSWSSPLLQIGDFPFSPYTGAIEDYRPADASAGGAYLAGVRRLVAAQDVGSGDYDGWDYFTIRPGDESRGASVYLAGHSYSGVQGTFQIAGTRLVLNTLFNLGAGCTESGVSCNTGQLGVCAEGVLTCDAGLPVCAQKNTASPETCNGLDDDCDGLVDEEPLHDPVSGAVIDPSCYDGPPATRDVGLCRAGFRSCVRAPDGSYALSACVGEITPSADVCNALDDDCDGQVDEGLSQACYFGPTSSLDPSGQPRGACRAGTQTCVEGNWGECAGQVLPLPEEACQEGSPGDGIDDDCNGIEDDKCACVESSTRPCYAGAAGTLGNGSCRAGTQTCTGGAWTACVGEVLPQPEVCLNGVDENCNGGADDGPPICAECRDGVDTEACYSGAPATRGVGVCSDGERACTGGEYGGACQGEVLPASGEPCDGLDNDCDGAVDDGAVCADGFTCTHGLCVPSTCGPEIPCPEGYSCSGGACTLLTGGCGGVTCDAGQACRFGACVDPCEGVVCGEGAVCASGACVGGSCYFAGCPQGQLCLGGACAADPCTGVVCPSGTFCRQGDCVQACAFVVCDAGERCGIDGFCVDDACAGRSCAVGQRCVDGACVADACAGKGCGLGQVCDDGVCVDDPCTGVVCPAGLCVAGQCYPSYNPTGSGGGDETGTGEGSGCGCGSPGAGAFSALLGLLAVPLARRRRPRRGGAPLALLVVATALLGVACKEEEEPFDPASCANVCELETSRCVDFGRDPSHCGACGQACPAASMCVDGVCGPAQAVAPFVSGVAPPSAPNGGALPVELVLSGERFAAGATLRVVGPAGTRTYPTALAAGRLTAAVDLADAPASTWQLRVVNPDHVISNAVPFDVFVPSPTLTAVTPPQVLAGETAVVLATGTGFAASSRCHLAGERLVEIVTPSTLGSSGLSCTIDATTIPPGNYEIWVVNDGGLSSGRRPFSVVSAEPVVTAVSPSGGEAGALVALTVIGTGFDATSRVYFDALELSPLFLDSTRLYVAQVALPECSTGTCAHQITVQNGLGSPSDPYPFTVGALQAQITGVSPGTGYQGDVVLVRFTGTAFPEGTVVQAAPPGGAFATLPSTSCTGGCTQIDGTLDLVGKPEGSWLVRLLLPEGASEPYAFRVLSNQAILRGAEPRGGAQGETKAVTLSAGNLRPPYAAIRVTFSDGTTPETLVPSPVPSGSPPTSVQVTIPLANRNTGTYTLAVVNPNGAAPSNAISFNVTPGPPTLTGVSPSTAPRRETPVLVVLTGSNFAKPDASGAGGSVVHISSPELGVTDQAVPTSATTVVSPTRIEVLLDTRTGVPGTYDVSVWNPGGPTPPQKSAVLDDAFTITP